MLPIRAAAAIILLGSAADSAAAKAPQSLDALAAETVRLQLEYDPTRAYGTELAVANHNRLPDRRPAALAAYEKRMDKIHRSLRAIDQADLTPAQRGLYAVLREHLEANKGLRVCRSELWAVDHLSGWQTRLPGLGSMQPVGTEKARAEALERWAAIPGFIDVEISNARAGLALGYSTPKSVVARVIGQVQRLGKAPLDVSPFYAVAKRDGDPAFQAAVRTLVVEKINPAIARYQAFLETEYLPKARDTIGVGALPKGEACYRASLRMYTTLDRSPRAVFELGKATVDGNVERVRELGRKNFGTEDLATIVKRVAEAPDNRFASEEEALAYSRAQVAKARTRSADFFVRLPDQDVVVEPVPDFMRGSGVSSHYRASANPSKPGEFRIALDNWKTMTRSDAQITAFHEAWPGHHLQIATAWSVPTNDLFKLVFNAAYIEGWGRYSEQLSEEMGLYEGDYPKIMRRMWPARGMVVDPGVHVLGWSREQAEAYVVESGRFTPAEAKDVIDRIAVLPGQATAYDSGGLEIFALRAEAEKALGDRFDVKAFHQIMLEAGIVPLSELRTRVERWISDRKAARAG